MKTMYRIIVTTINGETCEQIPVFQSTEKKKEVQRYLQVVLESANFPVISKGKNYFIMKNKSTFIMYEIVRHSIK